MLPKKNPKKTTTPKNKPKTLVCIGQMKIAMNTQMHEEFKWRYQNAELKQGLTSKTFQNSLKFWYFRVIKKQNNGRLLHLVKNTDAHYLRTNDH